MIEDEREIGDNKNVITLHTYDVIITKLAELEKRCMLEQEKILIKADALVDTIKRQDETNLIRFEGMNKVRELQADLLNRCATKEEMRLEITREVAALEKKISQAQNEIEKAAITAVGANNNRIGNLEVYMKIMVGGVFVSILLLLLANSLK